MVIPGVGRQAIGVAIGWRFDGFLIDFYNQKLKARFESIIGGAGGESLQAFDNIVAWFVIVRQRPVQLGSIFQFCKAF